MSDYPIRSHSVSWRRGLLSFFEGFRDMRAGRAAVDRLSGAVVDPEVRRDHRLAEHAAALSRLSHRLDVLRARRGVGQHLRAALRAYDQTLLLAASEVGITGYGHGPLSPVDRLTLEAELTIAGLRWQTVH